MKLNPTLDRIVIEKCDFDEIYKSSIVLTHTSKNDINKFIYKVIEVGPGGIINGNNIVIDIKPGDKVIVPEYIGSEINIDNRQFRIIKYNEILAIVED